MFCTNCGKQLPENSRFCDGCGQSLPAPSEPYSTPPYTPYTPVDPMWAKPAPSKSRRTVALCVILPIVAILSILAIILVVRMVSKGAEDDLVGKWRAEVDMSDLFNQELVDTDLSEYVIIHDLNVALILELDEDGTYSMTADEYVMADTMENVKEQIKDGLTDYLEDILEEEGVDMSVDEALSYMGMSLDDMINESFSEEGLDDLTSDFRMQGQYRVEDGKFYTSGSLYEEPGYIYERYTLDGDILSLDKGNGAVDSSVEQFLPLRFVRVD